MVFRRTCAKKKTAKKRDQKATEVFPRTRSDAPASGGPQNARRSRAGVPRPPKRRFSVVRRKGRRESRESFGVRACVGSSGRVPRGARVSAYLPGMPREMTAHLLPYTACAARIFLSSSSVNGPRFTEGLSWLHHLRGRNNEIRNNGAGWLERQRDARGRGGSARVAVEDQARKRASRAMRGRRTRVRRARGDSRGVARPRTRSGARAP